jgi:L-threonylcarbamoyladenylate synthase
MKIFDLRALDAAGRKAAVAGAITAAAGALRRGELVGIPTETVYGLAADATNARAVAGIYAAKGRPSFNPLIAHVADLAMAEEHGVFGPEARALAETFWPGPLTLVVPKQPTSAVVDLVTAGLDTLAIRLPDNAATLALIKAVGVPIAAPSANRSGGISATSAADVVSELGERVAVILDDGPSHVGLESTIVMIADGVARLLRPGGCPREAIEAVLGRPLLAPDLEPGDTERPLAPGMLTSHYAPNALVRVDATDIRAGEAWLGFGATVPPGLDDAVAHANLSPSADPIEAATNLFRMLRDLDASGARMIAVAPIPGSGLAEAIRDRLARAAAPRNELRS